MMFPSRTSETPTFSQFPQYLDSSSFGTTTNNQSLVATHQKTESPNLFITDNMNYSYDDPLVNNCHSLVFPSRIVQPVVGKKDKHCKIVTARGPRDRRMRLSIDVAKKFFGLQDMLGFDKASKTLDWLLTKSRPAIEELAQKKILAEVVEVMKSNNNGDPLQAEKLARESRRAKARERARERTRMKLSISTTINVDVEMGRQFCNNDEELCHGDMLLPCSTGNARDLSSLVESMNTTNLCLHHARWTKLGRSEYRSSPLATLVELSVPISA